MDDGWREVDDAVSVVRRVFIVANRIVSFVVAAFFVAAFLVVVVMSALVTRVRTVLSP